MFDVRVHEFFLCEASPLRDNQRYSPVHVQLVQEKNTEYNKKDNFGLPRPNQRRHNQHNLSPHALCAKP